MAELVLMVGLPGAGKSFYTMKYNYDRIFLHQTHILSSDQVRQELYGDINDQTHNEEVFQYIKEETKRLLEKGHRVIIDATNITRKSRKSITDYVEQHLPGFYEYGYIKYVVIATPYYNCLENNQKRDRQVPEEVIKRMYEQFEFPTYMESVHKIEIVYPFELDKDMYDIRHPYERLLNFSHDTPYHTMSVGEHLRKTYNIMKQITEDKVMLKASELHDIGKPFCKKFLEEENRANFLNHANVGSYEAMFYGKFLKFSENELIDLCNLIQFHMRIYNIKDDEKAIKKLKSIVGERLYYKLLMLNIADKEAH